MNRKTIRFLLVTIAVLSLSIFPENAGVLKELLKPNRIYLDQHHMYVTEGESILVYSLDNLKLNNKFGKKGEGPGEIISPFYIIPLKNKLFINSLGKVSFYSKEGRLISEIKSDTNGRNFFPLSNGYAGFVNNIVEKNIFFTVNLYNNKLDFVKELYREKTEVKRAGKIELFKRAFMHKTYKDRIYITGKDGFILDCLDNKGKVIYSTGGNFLSEQFIPLKLQYSMQPYPFAMKNNKVYQLIENEDTEVWELFINDLKL